MNPPYKGDTPKFVDNKGEPWEPALVMNNNDGFYSHILF